MQKGYGNAHYSRIIVWDLGRLIDVDGIIIIVNRILGLITNISFR